MQGSNAYQTLSNHPPNPDGREALERSELVQQKRCWQHVGILV